MKTYECVYTRANNENADSAFSLLCLLSEFDGDLSATMRCCRNWDDNGLVEVSKFKVITVCLPDWLPFAEYKKNQFGWELVFLVLKYRVKFDIDSTPYEKAKLLFDCPAFAKPGLSTLLFGKVRGDFSISLQNQIETWLQTSAAERKYQFPLSNRQLQALCYRKRGGGVDADLYRHSRYYEMKGL